jgi:hypothetical protein
MYTMPRSLYNAEHQSSIQATSSKVAKPNRRISTFRMTVVKNYSFHLRRKSGYEVRQRNKRPIQYRIFYAPGGTVSYLCCDYRNLHADNYFVWQRRAANVDIDIRRCNSVTINIRNCYHNIVHSQHVPLGQTALEDLGVFNRRDALCRCFVRRMGGVASVINGT